ncbi:AGE family epimerase/isomerase [Actinomyces vulturis]|uniref:AGE family epimerase/isomerase n=1 Tax=Actinomyces vulturis TaxID=1857645 RepID=UPI00082C8980|nr:AGE family epimerase/isomerase [Actinomyces vulturis]
MSLGWFESPEHIRWLATHTHALLRAGKLSMVPAGFGWIGPDGEVDQDRGVALWITGRMTFCFSLGTLLGIPGCRKYADHGVRSLARSLKDNQYGGYYSLVECGFDEEGRAIPRDKQSRKECYQHAFVLLAAATAVAANRPGATELLRDAMEIHERYFFDESYGLPIESFACDFTDPEEYRGINAAMHCVEAYLATADATGDVTWLERAVQIIDFAVNVQARNNSWRIPEHYDAGWHVDVNYNMDQPNHPFRPGGVTPGHGLEWARLTAQARAALIARKLPAGEWMLPAAEELFDRARIDGWRVDGNPGFVYTTDNNGHPLVRQRMHWTVCEGVSAAAMLRRAVLDSGRSEMDVEHYEHCYRSWVDYLEEYVIRDNGLWIHECTPENEPDNTVWPGHPDVYHGLQMTLAARMPVWPAMGQALAEGRLDRPESPEREEKPKGRRRLFS